MSDHDDHEHVEEARTSVVEVEEEKDERPAVDARAAAEIKRWKGIGGMSGFAVTALGAWMHGELLTSVLLRALIGGVAGYMIAWVAAVIVWRRIIRAEIHDKVNALVAKRRSIGEGDTS